MSRASIQSSRLSFADFVWPFVEIAVTSAIAYALSSQWTVTAGVGGFLFLFNVISFRRAKFNVVVSKPAVLWFTGLSGAGKSTLADLVFQEMKKRGIPVERLDGDTIRDIFPQTGFTREERNQHVKRIGLLASRLEANGVSVVASFISPYREGRDFVRGLCRNFVEIYVSTPIEECERRDVKGLYKKAKAGAIQNFTGVSDPYEAPLKPELSIDTTKFSRESAAEKILKFVTS